MYFVKGRLRNHFGDINILVGNTTLVLPTLLTLIMEIFNYTSRKNKTQPLLCLTYSTTTAITFNAVARDTVFTDLDEYPYININIHPITKTLFLKKLDASMRNNVMETAARIFKVDNKVHASLRSDILRSYLRYFKSNVYFKLVPTKDSLIFNLEIDEIISNTAQGIGINERDISPLRNTLLTKLPNSFKRKDAVILAKEIGISERACDKYVKLYLDNRVIIKQAYGNYSKINL